MDFRSLLLLLLGLLRGAHSLRNELRPTRVREVQVPNVPAHPIPKPYSDFKKNNVSARWAEGHPMEWGGEATTYEMPAPRSQDVFDASLSVDGKFLALSNSSDTRVFKVETGFIVSTPGHSPTSDNGIVELRSAPNGQYDLIIASRVYIYETKRHSITQVRLSAEGIPIGQPIEYPGDFSIVDATHFSKDGRRMLTQAGPVVNVYDLDNATFHLTLVGHDDNVVSEAFSPDGRYIATTALDMWTKIWDAYSGNLLHDIGPSDYQNALTVFSPNGKYLLISNGGIIPAVKLWVTGNFTSEFTTLGPFNSTVQKAIWSPNGEYLALCDYGEMIQIVRMSDLAVVQEWRQAEYWVQIEELDWIEGGKKLSYRILGGREIYDLEKNLKYRWSPGDYDHYVGSGRKTFYLR